MISHSSPHAFPPTWLTTIYWVESGFLFMAFRELYKVVFSVLCLSCTFSPSTLKCTFIVFSLLTCPEIPHSHCVVKLI